MGVTKLAIDENDQSMSIQNFTQVSHFTWNNGEHQMNFKHEPTNLLEFPKSWSNAISFALAAAASNEQFNKLTPNDTTNSF